MPVAVLFPRYDHPAIEERYASWQSRMLLSRPDLPVYFYGEDDAAADLAAEIEEDYVVVATDPLVLSAPALGVNLVQALQTSGAFATVPRSNESGNEAQRTAPPVPYLTLRELEAAASHARATGAVTESVLWDSADPGVFACRTEQLATLRLPLASSLRGKQVAVVGTEYVHRWSSLRGQIRTDLLDLISTDARSILEFGCGEAPLGAALKARQKCRVVGIEIDRQAAAIARKRIDDVYCGDVREIVGILNERFDWIIGGDIVEHLDEPWTFLAQLRDIAAPGGRLLLSLPNIASASIISDLLQGRFDYVYMGLTCVGHLRFFSKQSIEEMLEIAGWTVERILPQPGLQTPSNTELLARLNAAGVPYSEDDLQATGYYVIARNDSE